MAWRGVACRAVASSASASASASVSVPATLAILARVGRLAWLALAPVCTVGGGSTAVLKFSDLFVAETACAGRNCLIVYLG